MGTLEGFVMGQALAPTPEYNSGPIWRDHAEWEKERADQNYDAAEAWKAEAEKLSNSLEKEHKRFLVERQERRNYMRGWAVRGQVLREMCGYDEDRIVTDSDAIADKYDEKITKMADEKDTEINQQAGF